MDQPDQYVVARASDGAWQIHRLGGSIARPFPADETATRHWAHAMNVAARDLEQQQHAKPQTT